MRTTRLLVAALLSVMASVPFPGQNAMAVGGDPGLSQQWGIRQIGARASWDRGVVGGGAAVAVIDTGIDADHDDLRGQIAAAVTCVNTRGDAAKCTAGAADIQGHGTHVAGTAAAASNSIGVAGVAPEARIIAVRVFQEEVDPVTGEKSYFATSTDINAGIRWVIANVKTKGSINLSLGGDFVVTTIDGAGFEVGIEEAWKAGWVPVLASGNENLFGAGVAGSSNYGSLNAMVVGATGPDDDLARYSSPFGNAKWGIVAPGGNARSNDPDKSDCQVQPERCVLSTFNGGQYGFLQGTSMATPHVAGAAALLMGAGLTNSQAVQRLLDSANKTVSCGSNCKGRLDVAKATVGLGGAAAGGATAVTEAPAAATSPPPAPSGSPAPTGSSSGSGSPTTSRRQASNTTVPSTVAGAPPAAEAATVESVPETSSEAPAPAEEPASNDAFTGLSIEEAKSAVDSSSEHDRPPGLAIAVALAALTGSAGATFLRWRRRPA